MMPILTAERRAATAALLADLVRIPSINCDPAESDRSCPERAVVDYLEPLLRALGLATERQEARPGRPNLLARWPGEAAGRPLTLEAHTDTVGVAAMTVEPFGAAVREGRMWGRGTCDTKGSLAAFVSALRIAAEEGWRFSRPVQFVAAMGEETGCQGAVALTSAGIDLGSVIVGEPTSNRPVIAHKGCLWFTVTCHGRAAHGSQPQQGDNAIYRARRVLDYVLTDWLPALSQPVHPLLGPATANVGLIRGGEKVNVVPATCVLEVDHRVLPGVDQETALAAFREGLAAALEPADLAQIDVAAADEMFPGFAMDDRSELVRGLSAAIAAEGGDPRPCGVSYFSDAGPFCAAGPEAGVLGPGDIRHAHGPAEFVPLDELYQATAIVLRWLAEYRCP